MDQNKYRTDDFCLASYLLSADIPIIDTTRNSKGKVTFIFQKTENFEQLINDFLTFRARVEPLAYASAQKKLKHLIYFKA
jgi:hypothetical protein